MANEKFDQDLEKALAKAKRLSGGDKSKPKKKSASEDAPKEANDNLAEKAKDGTTESKLDEVVKAASLFNKAASKLKAGFNVASGWYKKAEPIANGLSKVFAYATLGLWPAAKWAAKKYGSFVGNSCFPKDPDTGLRGFSKDGALKAAFLSAAIWFAGIPTAKFSLQTAQQGVMETVSGRSGYYYITDSDVLVENELYSVSASDKLPANGDSTTHFHIERDVWHWLWYPEELYDAIPEEISFAVVDYNGVRWKPAGLYPEIKDILVFPLSTLPKDHPAHSGVAVTNADINAYIMKRLPVDHPAHDGAKITHADLENYMMKEPLPAQTPSVPFTPK